MARECAEDLADDNVVYAEVPFCARAAPGTRPEFGRGRRARSRRFPGRRIRCQGRGTGDPHRLSSHGDEACRAGRGRSPNSLCDSGTAGLSGFDIAGAEAGNPPSRHLDAFEYMRDANAHFTIHAGEAFGLPSIHEAIAFCGADRLGHGVRIVDDIDVGVQGGAELGRLANYVRDMRIPLELCPEFERADRSRSRPGGPSVRTLGGLALPSEPSNTDNRLMSDTTMSREMAALVETFGYGMDRSRTLHHQCDEVGLHPVRRAPRVDRRRHQAGLRRAHRLDDVRPTTQIEAGPRTRARVRARPRIPW